MNLSPLLCLPRGLLSLGFQIKMFASPGGPTARQQQRLQLRIPLPRRVHYLFVFSQILRLLWGSKIRYHVQDSPNPILIVSHLNPVHSLTPYLFNIISHSTADFPNKCLPTVFRPRIFEQFSSVPCVLHSPRISSSVISSS
jgi:hypothetical protein